MRAAFLLMFGGAGCAGLIGLGDYAIEDDGPRGGDAASDGPIVLGPEGSTCTGTLRGTIRDPAGLNVVPNAIVYVPSSTPSPMPTASACDTCASLMTGGPITSAVTNENGAFVLPNVPIGSSFPLVFLVGRWRRQVTVDPITTCGGEATLPSAVSTLPKDHLEGDVPRIAIAAATGDAHECLLRRMGIARSESTSPEGEGRIHSYRFNGGDSGPPVSELFDDPTRLATYDLVMAPCDSSTSTGTGPGAPAPVPPQTPAELANLKAYVEAGGRIFATHWTATHLVYGMWPPPAGPMTAEFGTNVDNDRGPPALPYTIDTTTAVGRGLAALPDAGATLTIDNWRHLAVAVDAGATRILYGNSAEPPISHSPDTGLYGGPHLGAYAFDAPWPGGHCGRVTVQTGHVTSPGSLDGGDANPCDPTERPMTNDERAGEALMFYAGACMGPPL